MKITPASIPDVLLVEPRIFGDDRGFFYESFNEREWYKKTGLNTRFVQHNHSRSVKNVLRGIHYQIQNPQGKLVRVVVGEIFDVAVDLRRNSNTFGKWVGQYLSADNKKSLWIRCILWNDVLLNINWPFDGTPIISKKDEQGLSFKDAEVYEHL